MSRRMATAPTATPTPIPTLAPDVRVLWEEAECGSAYPVGEVIVVSTGVVGVDPATIRDRNVEEAGAVKVTFD